MDNLIKFIAASFLIFVAVVIWVLIYATVRSVVITNNIKKSIDKKEPKDD